MSPVLNLEHFVDLGQCLHGDQFKDKNAFAYLGKPLGEWLRAFLEQMGCDSSPVIAGEVSPAAHIEGQVYVAHGAKVEPTAYIQGPTYIGPGAEVRHGAYVRGNVYVGPKAVVGHASEVKGSVLFDGAKAAHFAYVGDAILGRDVNLGAGTKLANLKIRRSEVFIKAPKSGENIGSGLSKFSAIMGDGSGTGCNSVLNPGTLLLPGAAVLACESFLGTLERGFYRHKH